MLSLAAIHIVNINKLLCKFGSKPFEDAYFISETEVLMLQKNKNKRHEMDIRELWMPRKIIQYLRKFSWSHERKSESLRAAKHGSNFISSKNRENSLKCGEKNKFV